MSKHITPFNLGTPLDVMERVATYINRLRAIDRGDRDTAALYDEQFTVQELTESGILALMYLDAMHFKNCNTAILVNILRTVTVGVGFQTSLNAYQLLLPVFRNLNEVICDENRCGSIEEMDFPDIDATKHDLVVVDELVQAHHESVSLFLANAVRQQAEEETGERVDEVITPSLEDTLAVLQKMFVQGQAFDLKADGDDGA